MSTPAGCIVHESTLDAETVHVIGEVDSHIAAQLEDIARHVLLLGRPLTIDATRCHHLGSLGMRVLLRVRQSARAGFATYVTAGTSPANALRTAKVEALLGVRVIAQTTAGTVPDPDEEPHIVALDGEWDLSRGQELRLHIERACRFPHVVVDMSGTRYIDSHCLGMLVRMRTHRVAKGYEAAVIVLSNANIRKVLRIAGFDMLWTFCETLEEALALTTHSGNIAAATPT